MMMTLVWRYHARMPCKWMAQMTPHILAMQTYSKQDELTVDYGVSYQRNYKCAKTPPAPS